MSRAVVSVESFVDALVGCFGLAVDAVGVDLEQDSDAVADAASDFGGGTPAFSHSDTAVCLRS
jgi:hypothetical protein